MSHLRSVEAGTVDASASSSEGADGGVATGVPGGDESGSEVHDIGGAATAVVALTAMVPTTERALADVEIAGESPQPAAAARSKHIATPTHLGLDAPKPVAVPAAKSGVRGIVDHCGRKVLGDGRAMGGPRRNL
jgi:hypothetical protein